MSLRRDSGTDLSNCDPNGPAWTDGHEAIQLKDVRTSPLLTNNRSDTSNEHQREPEIAISTSNMNSVHKAETIVYDPERVRPDGAAVQQGTTNGRSGFRVSHSSAFLLTFLALVLAIGVGVIVFFSIQRPAVTCNCRCANTKPPVGQRYEGATPTSQCPTQAPLSSEEEWSRCLNLSERRIECLPGQLCPSIPPTSTISPTYMPKVKNMRLPTDVIPDVYDLVLQPNLYEGPAESFTFNGSVSIILNCRNDTDVIKIHTVRLNISADDVSVWEVENKIVTSRQLALVNVTYDFIRQWHVIQLKIPLVKGKDYQLRIDQFSGPLKDDLKGLYLSSYQEGNVTKYLATSQLQPTDARKVFPCFDEPAFKARFNVTLVRKSHFHSIANMPRLEERDLGGDWKADVYKRSVKMSTYILAFIVSELANLTEFDKDHRMFRVWSRPAVIKSANYSLWAGMKILEFFESYFDVKYPLPKTDMAAVPDFSAGAMENWGLIIYREASMLFDPLYGSEDNLQKVAIIISHEIAHMWFGNLVTLEWWDDLWLNEGFASFMEYVGVNAIHPEWKMDEQFLVEDMHRVMMYDSEPSSRAVFTEVSKPDEINEIFDPISYSKGSSVLRMLEGFLGEAIFRRGVKKYLKRHHYSNTVHNDLWIAFSQAADEFKKKIPVKVIMDTWIKQMGYPIVNITRSGGKLRLTQEHFLLNSVSRNRNDKDYIENNATWHIPLTWTSKSECDWSKTEKVTWMSNRKLEIDIKSVPKDDWFIFNIQQKGYYRVNYDLENWYRIVEQLKANHTVIDVRNRAQLLDDVFNLAKAGILPYTLAFNLTNYLEHETEFVAWRTAMYSLSHISSMLELDPYHGVYKKFVLSRLSTLYSRLAWNEAPGDDHLRKKLRNLIINYACQMQHENCVKQALDRFQKWKMNTSFPIAPSLRQTVYCVGIRYGNVQDWEFLYQYMKNAESSFEKSKATRALACTQEGWLLNRYLMLTLDEKEIRAQDIILVISSVVTNPNGRYLTLDFLSFFFDNITADTRVGQSGFNFRSLINVPILPINNPAKNIELQAFRAKLQRKQINMRPLERALKTVISNIQWMVNHRTTIGEWLRKRVGDLQGSKVIPR